VALSGGHDIRFQEVEVLDRSQRYFARLTREAIEIFKHENIINRKEEITLLDSEWKRTLSQTSLVQPPIGVDVLRQTPCAPTPNRWAQLLTGINTTDAPAVEPVIVERYGRALRPLRSFYNFFLRAIITLIRDG